MDTAGMSQSELARRLETPPSTLQRWFNGSMPRRLTLTAAAKILGTTEEWLKTGIGKAPSKESDKDTALQSSVLYEHPTPFKVERFGNDFFKWDASRVELVESTLKKLSRAMNYAAVADPDTEQSYKELASFYLEEFYEQAKVLRTTRPPAQVRTEK